MVMVGGGGLYNIRFVLLLYSLLNGFNSIEVHPFNSHTRAVIDRDHW